MKIKLIGVDMKGALDISNFSKLEYLEILYKEDEYDRVSSFIKTIVNYERVSINEFYSILENKLNHNIVKFPLQGKVIIEFLSIDKTIVPKNYEYTVTFKTKLYIAKDANE